MADREDVVEPIEQTARRPIKEIILLTLKFLKLYWKIVFALTWLLILIILLMNYNTSETRCAFVVLLLAGYWITECFPMAVTSIIPVVLFPAFGILTSQEACGCYMNDTIMVFIGGLILAIAIEHSGLHLRIALGVMKVVGCTHAKILGSLCVVTTLISMWITNTATTAMMVPIIFAILNQLEQAGLCEVYIEKITPETAEPIQEPTNITKAYLLAAAYCSSIGGTGTLVGTGTNLTFKGIFESTFPLAEPITFTNWMIASIPQMIVNSFLTWIYLRIAFMGYLRPESKDAVAATIGAEGEAITNEVIDQRYKELGKMSFHELSVAILFVICVILWLFRKPGFVVGWAEYLTQIDVRDSLPVIGISVLMFYIPKDLNFLQSYSRDPQARPLKSSEGLITWKLIESKMPWGLMFLLGGGFAISRATVASGMAKMVGEAMKPLRYLPPALVLLFVSFLIGLFTEFTANVGVANITLPIVAQMCIAMDIHPLYLMVPTAIMCSYSFRLPVGTPPNAIIAMVGKLKTKYLMIGGCIPSIYTLLINTIFFLLWGSYVWGTGEFPEWAEHEKQNVK